MLYPSLCTRLMERSGTIPGDLSACKLEMCTVCNTQGCFSSNGAISRIFLEKTAYRAFPPNKELTSKWASTDSTVCFVGSRLQCAALKELSQAPSNSGSPAPTVVGPGPLGAPIPQGPMVLRHRRSSLAWNSKPSSGYSNPT